MYLFRMTIYEIQELIVSTTEKHKSNSKKESTKDSLLNSGEFRMWGNLPSKYKKKLNIIVFIFFPVLFTIGFFLSAWTVRQLNLTIDKKGLLVVFISLIPLYFISVKSVYKKIKKASMENSDVR